MRYINWKQNCAKICRLIMLISHVSHHNCQAKSTALCGHHRWRHFLWWQSSSHLMTEAKWNWIFQKNNFSKRFQFWSVHKNFCLNLLLSQAKKDFIVIGKRVMNFRNVPIFKRGYNHNYFWKYSKTFFNCKAKCFSFW